MPGRMNIVLSVLIAMSAIWSCGGGSKVDPAPKDTRSMTIGQDIVKVPYQENKFSIQVSANFEYTVSIEADWIREDESASTAFMRAFIAAGNEHAGERSGVIRFTDKNDRYYSKSVTVTQEANPVSKVTLHIVDKNATEETKALFANLWKIADTGWMFGHHDDLWYGRYWYDEAGKSDTKAVCGDYLGVFSVYFAEIMDDRHV